MSLPNLLNFDIKVDEHSPKPVIPNGPPLITQINIETYSQFSKFKWQQYYSNNWIFFNGNLESNKKYNCYGWIYAKENEYDDEFNGFIYYKDCLKSISFKTASSLEEAKFLCRQRLQELMDEEIIK